MFGVIVNEASNGVTSIVEAKPRMKPKIERILVILVILFLQSQFSVKSVNT